MELSFNELSMMADMEDFMYSHLGFNLSFNKNQINNKLQEKKYANGSVNRAIEKFIESEILVLDKNNTYYYDSSNAKKIIKSNKECIEMAKKIIDHFGG